MDFNSIMVLAIPIIIKQYIANTFSFSIDAPFFNLYREAVTYK